MAEIFDPELEKKFEEAAQKIGDVEVTFTGAEIVNMSQIIQIRMQDGHLQPNIFELETIWQLVSAAGEIYRQTPGARPGEQSIGELVTTVERFGPKSFSLKMPVMKLMTFSIIVLSKQMYMFGGPQGISFIKKLKDVVDPILKQMNQIRAEHSPESPAAPGIVFNHPPAKA